MTTPKEFAISLLAKGISTSQVAAAVGVSDSYISQLKADPETAALIASQQAAADIADVRFDERLDDAESQALNALEKSLPYATFGQALAAFRVLNAARRRNDAPIQSESTTSITVNLTLPASSIPHYVTNSRSEIVEVDGQLLATASVKTLDQMLLARSNQRAESTLDRVVDLQAKPAQKKMQNLLDLSNL